MPATKVGDNGAAVAAPVPAVPPRFRHAVKAALSLTLAYLIPMALGWAHAQTAATTVMLIAAASLVSESLQKGVLRVLGTIAGAVVGLSLIALFPQDRMSYLLAVSITVAISYYLYNAYQGDGTIFMLTAVVTLMVFNGGDASGAFLYGVDRALMTVFGVIVYTAVASCLWPVRAVDNTRSLAAGLGRGYSQAFDRLVRPEAHGTPPLQEQLTNLLAQAEAFQTHFASVRGAVDGVADYQGEWDTVVSCYEELQSLLVPALHQSPRQEIEYGRYLRNYYDVLEQINLLFTRLDKAWQLQDTQDAAEQLEIVYDNEGLELATHLVSSAAFTRAELLTRTQSALVDLDSALRSMLFDRGGFKATRQPRGKPAFIWLDLENFKTSVRAFVSFWIATAIWIVFNPPGGFTFVTMCTLLVPLASYTPVTPKLLVILFSLGFFFALPAYIFLLPHMTHWFELGAFLLSYAFIGFFVFQGPVSIFFLLGLFTLGIQNTMSYHFDAIVLSMLMFYMVCATLIAVLYIPFTSRPETIYISLQRRFFRHCGGSITYSDSPTSGSFWQSLHAGNGASLLAKMQFWGTRIDADYFFENTKEKIEQFNRASELLLGEVQALEARKAEFASNPLIAAARRKKNANPLAKLCLALSQGKTELPFSQIRERLGAVEHRLDEILGVDYLKKYDRQQLAQFYVYLNLQASILGCIENCRIARESVEWQQLSSTRF